MQDLAASWPFTAAVQQTASGGIDAWQLLWQAWGCLTSLKKHHIPTPYLAFWLLKPGFRPILHSTLSLHMRNSVSVPSWERQTNAELKDSLLWKV